MPISRNSKNLNIVFGLLVIMLSLSSCYENVEGCLDRNSSNYNVASDVDCEDCCTYPTLSLLVAYVLGETSYNRMDTMTNDIGIEFVIEDAQFYFSEIVLSDGTEDYRIDETFEYSDINGTDRIAIDDIALVIPNVFRYSLGTFTQSNDYTRLMINLGVPEIIDKAQSITVTSDHPLVQAGDSLFIVDQNQYVNSWILLRQVGVHDIADTLQITGTDFTYVFDDILISQARGSSLDVNIKINYEQLILGIDYNTMNKSEVIATIGNNLTDAVLPNF